MAHTAIPEDELKVFESLKDVRIVFDVGARDDVDYLILKPKIKLHAFEPNPAFFEELKAQLKDYPNVYLNNYGLGDKEGEFGYSEGSESFRDGGGINLPMKTLDSYVKEHQIKRIDFLKIDTEGFDLKVLQGGLEALKICRYIQYEHWDNDADFHKLLENDFDMAYIGGRNTICWRKGEAKPWIPKVPQEGGLLNKTEKNKLDN